MTRKIVVLAAALAAALPLSLAVSQTAFAQAQVQSLSAPLPVVTPQSVESELAGDKASFVILTGDDCNVCADLARLAAKYPQMKFLQGKGADFQAPDAALPVVIINVPGVGPTFQQEKFATTDLEKFVAEHVDFASRQTAAANKVTAIRESIRTTSQPFDEDLKKLREEFKDLWKPYGDRIEAERAKAEKAAAPFEAQSMALAKKQADERAPLVKKMREIEGRARAAVQADPETVARAKTVADLRKSFADAQTELEQLKEKGVDGKDVAFTAVTDKMAALEKAFSETVAAARTRSAEVMKPFIEEAKPVAEQLEAINKKFEPQVTDLNDKVEAATKPFATEAAKIEAEGKLMLKPHFDAVETVRNNKKRAITPLRDELSKAMTDLETALDETTTPAK